MTLCPQDLFKAGPAIFSSNMLTSSRSLSVPEFLRKSTLDRDGNPFLETIRRPIFNAWSVDTCHRDPSQYQLVSGPKQLHQDTLPGGCGALSLEHLARRQIIKNHLSEINESMLRRLEWYGRGKKLWEDVLASGADNWKVFARFCEVYGHESDFVAMLEDGGAGLTTRAGKEQMGVVYSSERGKMVKKTTTCTGNNFRYRSQLIKGPLPPWSASIPLLTAPTPKLNNGDFSWLVCLELTSHAFDGQTWSEFDLQYSLGTLPNLAILSIHGSSFSKAPHRIVQDGYLTEWARHARQGHKWASLRILVIEETLDALLATFRPPARHHTDLKKIPPPPPPPPRRGLFEELDSFPKLSVVSFHFSPPPSGWNGDKISIQEPGSRPPHYNCPYPLYNNKRAGELFTEGDKKGWFSERMRDFEGTLRERPREIKELVRTAGTMDVRKLAQAGAALVECERKEKERLLREREMELNKPTAGKGKAQIQKQQNHNNSGTKQDNSKSNKSLPASNAVPPIMVNVIFDTTIPPNNHSPSGRKVTKLSYTGRNSPTNQESLNHRMILFEKKRPVELTPQPQSQLKSPAFAPSIPLGSGSFTTPTTNTTTTSVGKKRKGGDGERDRKTNWDHLDGSSDNWGNEGYWDRHGHDDNGVNERDEDGNGMSGEDRDGKTQSSTTGTGTRTGMHKKQRTGNEHAAKEMSDFLAEFMDYSWISDH